MSSAWTLSILRLNLLLLLIFTLTSSVACMCTIEPNHDLVIENQSGQLVTIYLEDDYKIGDVNSGEQMTYNLPEGGPYHISAKNSQDEEIYYREFTFQDLSETNWKVVIPLPE